MQAINAEAVCSDKLNRPENRFFKQVIYTVTQQKIHAKASPAIKEVVINRLFKLSVSKSTVITATAIPDTISVLMILFLSACLIK